MLIVAGNGKYDADLRNIYDVEPSAFSNRFDIRREGKTQETPGLEKIKNEKNVQGSC